MKKVLILLFLATQMLWSQDTSSPELSGKNEIKFDVLGAFGYNKYQMVYERFLNNGFSIGVSGAILDTDKPKKEFSEGFNRTLPEVEINPFLRYNLSKGKKSYYFAEFFTSFNSGKYRELQRLVDENNNGYYSSVQKSYSDVALGGALGYKFYIKERIGIDIFFGAGKNLFKKDESPAIIPRIGANLGYRF